MGNEKKSIVPELRFPEFRDTGAWKIKPFSRLFSIGNGRDHKHLAAGDIPVYGSGGYMRSVNEFLYDGESVCIGRKGTIDNPMLLSGKFWTVDTLFYTHSFNDCSPQFIYSIFQSIDWLKHNEAGGVPSLSKNNIEKIETAIPSPPEQQKIADCLTSADELITAQAQKVKALKAHKKGLMQQLFPRPERTENGQKIPAESKPRLRFPEFDGAADWVEDKLQNIFDLQDGFSFGSQDFVKSKKDAIQVIRITDINNENANDDKVYIPLAFLEANNLRRYAVESGDLLLSLTGAAGFNFFSWDGGRAVINQRTSKITPKEKSNFAMVRLLEPLIHEKINLRGEGQNNNLSKEFLSSVIFRFPAPEEQNRIADCLTSLDDLIAAHTAKLAALKTHKKGLMQQLFPAPNEVAA